MRPSLKPKSAKPKPKYGKLSKRARTILDRTRAWIEKREKFIRGVKLD